MFIFIGIGVLLLIGILMGTKGEWMNGDDKNKWYGMDGSIITVFTAIVLFVMVIAFPVTRLEYKMEIKGFEAVKQTVEVARENESIDDTAMQLKIIESNEWLAKAQFMRSVWKSWVPKEILDLKPIR